MESPREIKQYVLETSEGIIAIITRTCVGNGKALSDYAHTWVAELLVDGKYLPAGETGQFERHHKARSWVHKEFGGRLAHRKASFRWVRAT